MSRIVFWKAGLKMLRDNPLLGVGPRNFSQVRLQEYLDFEGPVKAYVPHSIYIQALSELGLLGTAPMVMLWVLVFRLNSKTRKRLLAQDPGNRRSFEYCLASGLDLGMVGYLSSGAFVAVLYYPHHWLILGLSLGLYTACSAKPPQTVPEIATGQSQTMERVPA
jgi:O-antigen ligase